MTERRAGRSRVNVARVLVGLIWLAGAAFNLLVTTRMEDPYGWIARDSAFPLYRWYFREVVDPHPVVWTLLLVAWEAATGGATLARGQWPRLGLTGGVLFSAFLFTLVWPYTLMMGPYALFLAWLARRHHRLSDRATEGPMLGAGRREAASPCGPRRRTAIDAGLGGQR